MRINNKEYTIKVYRPDRSTLLKVIQFFDFDPFVDQINSGLSELVFYLPNKFDDYGEGSVIDYMNHVELWVVDGDNSPYGQVIYSGYVYGYGIDVSGTQEQVSVSCYGYVSLMAQDLLRNGTAVILKTSSTGSFVTSGDASAQDVSSIAKAAIDRHVAESSGVVNYSTSPASVDLTGVTMAYVFDKQMVTDAIATAMDAAPAGWYWHVGADNVFHMHAKPSTATHVLTFGKDFLDLNVLKNSDSVYNNVLFESDNSDAQLLKLYTDSTSVTKYRPRWKVLTDSRVTVSSTADAIGNSELASDKDPKIRIVVEIVDNNVQDSDRKVQTGYDIERFKPGDTVEFRNVNPITALSFTSSMQIMKVTYSPYSAKLELEQLQDNIARQTYEAYKAAQEAAGTSGLTNYNTSQISGDVGSVAMGMQSSNYQDPDGRWWLICNGQAVSRTTYANLFSFFLSRFGSGTYFGSGDGSTTFNLPDMGGRFPIGSSGSYLTGSTGGSLTHNHGYNMSTITNAGGLNGSQRIGNTGYGYWLSGTAGAGSDSMDVMSGQATQNASVTPPYFALTFFVKA